MPRVLKSSHPIRKSQGSSEKLLTLEEFIVENDPAAVFYLLHKAQKKSIKGGILPHVLEAGSTATEEEGSDTDESMVDNEEIEQADAGPLDALLATTNAPIKPPLKFSLTLNPPPLNNGQWPTFKNWRFLMERNFKENGGCFDTPLSRLNYLITQTVCQAQDDLIARLRSKNLPPISDVDDAFKYLCMLYGDPHADVTFEEWLDKEEYALCWDKENFHDSLSDAIRAMMECDIPEDKWVHHLHKTQGEAIRPELEKLSSYENASFVEFANDCYRANVKLAESVAGNFPPVAGSSHPPSESLES